MVTDFQHFAPKKIGAGVIARPFALYCRENRLRPTMSFLPLPHVIPSVAEESRPHPGPPTAASYR